MSPSRFLGLVSWLAGRTAAGFKAGLSWSKMASPDLVFEARFQLAQQWWEEDFYRMVQKWLDGHAFKPDQQGIAPPCCHAGLTAGCINKVYDISCYYILFGQAGLTAGFELCGGQV